MEKAIEKITLAAALEALENAGAGASVAQFEDVLEAMKGAPLAVTPEAVAAFWGPARAAHRAFVEAMDAYDADLKARQAVLDGQAKSLDGQITDLETRACQLECESRDADSSGDLDAAAAADEQAETLRKQAATARRKRRIATSAGLKGDPTRFEAVQAAESAYIEICRRCLDYVREAVALTAEWAKGFDALAEAARRETGRGPKLCGYDAKRRESIDRTARPEYYARVEAQAAADRERQQAEQARREAIESGRLVIG